MIIRRHIIGRSTLSGAYMEAADTSKDGTINVKDSMIIRNHIPVSYTHLVYEQYEEC